MPFLRTEHGFSYTLASLHFSAFALGGVLIGLFGDRVVQCWGRRASLWGGGAGMAGGAMLLVVSPTILGTVAGAFAMGMLGTLLLITVQAVLADRHEEWSAVALTESNAAASASAILASLAVGVFATLGLGWRAALVLPIVVLVLLAASFHGEPLRQPYTNYLSTDRTPRALPWRFWAYSGVLFLGVSVEWCMAYWGADFLENETGLGRSAAASALSMFFVGMLLGRVFGSRLARLLPSTSLLRVTLCVALAGFPLFWLSEVPTWGLLGLFVVGLGIGSIYPLAISVGAAAAQGRTDKATARFALSGGGAILLAPFILGTLADLASIGEAYVIVVPLLLMAVMLTLLAEHLET